MTFAGKALEYGLKGYYHYQKHKNKYKAAYAVGTTAYNMVKSRKRKGTPVKWGGNKRVRLGKSNSGTQTPTWGQSSSAYKKKNASTQTKRRRTGNVNVEGTYSFSKTIKYKQSKLGKVAKFIGAKYIKEIQRFDLLYHDPADVINSQKSEVLDTIYGGGSTGDIVNCMQECYTVQNPANPLFSAANPLIINNSECIKFYLDGCKSEYEFTNMSAGSATITFYTVMHKQTKSSVTTPLTDWDTGLDAMAGSGTGGDRQVTGNKPTTSKLFNMGYKIVQQKRVFAGPGAKVNYTFNFKPQSVVDSEYFFRYSHVRGLTYTTFVVTHGQLGLTAASQVAPKGVQWIYTSRKTYTTRAVSHSAAVIRQIFDLSTTTIAAAGPVAVREDDGELES